MFFYQIKDIAVVTYENLSHEFISSKRAFLLYSQGRAVSFQCLGRKIFELECYCSLRPVGEYRRQLHSTVSSCFKGFSKCKNLTSEQKTLIRKMNANMGFLILKSPTPEIEMIATNFVGNGRVLMVDSERVGGFPVLYVIEGRTSSCQKIIVEKMKKANFGSCVVGFDRYDLPSDPKWVEEASIWICPITIRFESQLLVI